MNRSQMLFAASCVVLAACSKTPTPAEPPSVVDKSTEAPSMVNTPPAATPETHAGEPAAAPANPAPVDAAKETGGAQDNAAQSPLEPMSKEKESASMPLPLQGNNHSSDSVQSK